MIRLDVLIRSVLYVYGFEAKSNVNAVRQNSALPVLGSLALTTELVSFSITRSHKVYSISLGYHPSRKIWLVNIISHEFARGPRYLPILLASL